MDRRMLRLCSAEDYHHLCLLRRSGPRLQRNVINNVASFLQQLILAAGTYCFPEVYADASGAGTELHRVDVLVPKGGRVDSRHICAIASGAVMTRKKEVRAFRQVVVSVPNGREQTCFAIAPNGLQMASGDDNGCVHLYRDDGTMLNSFSCGEESEIGAIAFAPSGSSLAAAIPAIDDRIFVIAVDRGLFSVISASALLDGKFNGYFAYMWSGQELVLGCSDRHILGIASIASGVVRYASSTAECTCFASAHQWVSVGCKDGHVMLVDAHSCEVHEQVQPNKRVVCCLAFSIDGEKLIGGFDGGFICLMSVKCLNILKRFQLPCDWIDSLAILDTCSRVYENHTCDVKPSSTTKIVHEIEDPVITHEQGPSLMEDLPPRASPETMHSDDTTNHESADSSSHDISEKVLCVEHDYAREEWKALVPIKENDTNSECYPKCLLCDKWIRDKSHERKGGSEKHQRLMWYIENKDDPSNTWYRDTFLPWRESLLPCFAGHSETQENMQSSLPSESMLCSQNGALEECQALVPSHEHDYEREEWKALVPIKENDPNSERFPKCLLCDKWITDNYSHQREGGSKDHQWRMWYIENKDDPKNTWYREILLPWRESLMPCGAAHVETQENVTSSLQSENVSCPQDGALEDCDTIRHKSAVDFAQTEETTASTSSQRLITCMTSLTAVVLVVCLAIAGRFFFASSS